jgi:hypothetical protein
MNSKLHIRQCFCLLFKIKNYFKQQNSRNNYCRISENNFFSHANFRCSCMPVCIAVMNYLHIYNVYTTKFGQNVHTQLGLHVHSKGQGQFCCHYDATLTRVICTAEFQSLYTRGNICHFVNILLITAILLYHQSL